MRRHDLAAVCVLFGALALAGCSRLTFVKSDAQRRSAERVAPEYTFKESPRSRQRAEARNLLASAERKLAAGDVAGASADARAAQKADPASADPLTAMGLIATRQGDARAAGVHFARAAELAPGDGVVLANYGAWLCANGRPDESLPWFEKALASVGNRQRADTLANAGACALDAGRPEVAERAARASIDLDDANALALGTLAEYNYQTGRYFEARAFSERRLAAAPATPDALRLASQIEQKLGDSVAATRYVQRLRTEFPQARTAGPGGAETP